MAIPAFMTGLPGALAVLICTAAAQAAVTEQAIQRPYTVHVQPGETLRQALNGATPIAVNGERFHGYTRWNVRWTFRWWREASGRCSITEVQTHLRTEVQLPQLRTATPAQQAVFDRYLSALSRHEQGMSSSDATRRRPSTRASPGCPQQRTVPRWSARPTPWATGCSGSTPSGKRHTTSTRATAPRKARGWTERRGQCAVHRYF